MPEVVVSIEEVQLVVPFTVEVVVIESQFAGSAVPTKYLRETL